MTPRLLALSALLSVAHAVFTGYDLTSMQQTSNGYVGVLELPPNTMGPYGSDVTPLALNVYFETNQRLHVTIVDAANARFRVPGVVNIPEVTVMPSAPDYVFAYTSSPFGFSIVRQSTGEVIFNSTIPESPAPGVNGLIFENQYIEISNTGIGENPNIYGLGERVHAFRLDPSGKNYTMWNVDQGTPVDQNLYGTHPFYMQILPSGNAHGVFLLNSNAHNVFIQPNALTWQVIGGVLDFYFFLGSTPNDVVSQYHNVIGLPHMPPYWALGFHQCRWGYHTIQETAEVVLKYAENQIPLDTMWNDIDYMNEYEDFSLDPVRFPPTDVRAFIDYLHSQGQHYICIVDPGIHNVTGYEPWDSGLEGGNFIMNPEGNYPEIGHVWPGFTGFPDFWNEATVTWWTNLIEGFRANFSQVDGLWIDMNEISNFCEGDCGFTPTHTGQPFDPNYPPFVPGDMPLWLKTIDLASFGANKEIQYNMHSLFGFSETVATRAALEGLIGKRSVVISRSTYAGSGYYGGHWLGDNTANYEDLYYSIPGILDMNMFGIPLVGADICGFNDNTTEELCTRWIQLGAFYPFSRNHNAINQISQELYVWPQVANVGRNVLNIRYSLLPYYYTLFFEANQNGGTVARAVCFEFPADSMAWYIDRQFLIGRGLLISPVLDQGNVTVSAYFPADIWYDFYEGFTVVNNEAQWLTLDAPIDFIPLHVRGGTIIPMQEPALTTTAARQNAFSLLVAAGQPNGNATGSLFLDDGESLTSISSGMYSYIQYNYATSDLQGTLTNTFMYNNYSGAADLVLNQVTIFGVSIATASVQLNGQPWFTYTYSSANSTLSVYGLGLAMNEDLNLVWSGY